MTWLSRTGFLVVAGLVAWASACGSSTGNNTTATTHATASSSSAGAGGHGGGAGGHGSGTGGATTSATTSAHTGSSSAATGGHSGAGGAGGTGGAGCSGTTKLCGTTCVSTDDPAHGCGAPSCDPCTNAHGTTACSAGACTPSCDPGYGDCDGDPQNGCEATTTTDVANCGMCGNGCSVANGTAGCAGSACTVVSCDAGYADCNSSAADGCETHLDADAGNCGACGRACSSKNVASKVCAAGLCASTCVLGKGNCLEPAAPAADDGCETDTTASSLDCGGCGNSCENAMFDSDPSCDEGQAAQKVCGCSTFLACEYGGHTAPTCNGLGRCVCNGTTCQASEACKDPTAVDGTAGDVCTCYGGAACAAGQSCCQTPLGCFDLSSDAANCGACGHACAPGFACEGGVCSCNATGAVCDGGGAMAGSFSCPSIAGPDVCACGNATCTAGQRCRADGSCG